MYRQTKIVISLLALLASANLSAREVAGVSLPEQIKLGGQTLPLNGAGIRTKFVFDIYVGALYLPQKTRDVKQALNMTGPKRVLMHFLYDEVEKDRLIDGWKEGFENNLSEKDFATIKPRLESFNKLFATVRHGDKILLDYIPGSGTRVIINKQLQGTIPGEDFNRALLKVWLGDDPADEDLKEAMLDKADD